MFGCLKPFFSSPIVPAATALENHPKKDDCLTSVALKRIRGKWSPRLAELNVDNKIVLWKTSTETRGYYLTGVKKLVLGAGKNSLHAKMTLYDGEKLYLKLKGPELDRWARRLTDCKFPAKIERSPVTPVPRAVPIMKPILDSYGRNLTPYPGSQPASRISSAASVISLPMAQLVKSTPNLQRSLSIELGQIEEQQQIVVIEPEEGEEEKDNGLVVRMARVFEPDFPKKGILRRRSKML